VGVAGTPGVLVSPGVLVGEFKTAKLQNAKCKRDERCRWCSLGVRALPVGMALFFDNEKGRNSTPDPRQDKIGFVLDIGV
jgi:hypothetical protein